MNGKGRWKIGYRKEWIEHFNIIGRICLIIESWEQYHRLVDLSEFKGLSKEKIKSSGYVVDTLEAADGVCFIPSLIKKQC